MESFESGEGMTTSPQGSGELKFVSLADSVFERIENDILSGKFRPGDTYTECTLSKLFGVSRTPVREAIRRLEQEGLIRITTKGAEILGVDMQDLEDIYEIRGRLEGLAAKKCAKKITDEELASLKEIIELHEFYTQKGLSDKIKDTDSEFHETIYAVCGSDIYSSVLSSLHRRIRKYRKLSVQNPTRAAQAAKEHREIYTALENHDGNLAEKLTAQHIENAHKNIINSFNE
ncbi:MAG: GntR family transcriptional regulator [Clostridia bacterium]|nr:GntR family transcriptional regulator [Clostridia bacterium]